MKLCEYVNGGVKCKNWVVTSNDDGDVIYCPIHAGIAAMKRPHIESEYERKTRERFQIHLDNATRLDNDQLAAHILQLDVLLEDVKLRQQAASQVRGKRMKELATNGLTEAQKAELNVLRGYHLRGGLKEEAKKTPLSREEKEIQRMMKLGMSREKAMKLLGLDE